MKQQHQNGNALIYIVLITSLIFFGLTFDKKEKDTSGEIEIIWVENLPDDFSFTENWDYPEGVYKNEFGQLSCDGFCPPEIDRMKDENGKIYEDSLKTFYQLVDTTHRFHTIQSEAWTYEWAGTNFITAERINADTILCFTQKNAATHSSLMLTITKDKCIPIIELSSVVTGEKIYNCKSGHIEIDKNLWAKGIFKANFEFVFDHTENPDKPMYWKGKIYATIDKKVAGTDNSLTKYFKDQFAPSKDFMHNWIYFDLTDTIELKIIHHIPATMVCNSDIKTFSITIGIMHLNDTIRVLDLCNRAKEFNPGDIVAVIPANKPEEYYTHPGVFVQGYPGQLRPGYYDSKILETTYGILKAK